MAGPVHCTIVTAIACGRAGAHRAQQERAAEGRHIALLLQLEALLAHAAGGIDGEHQLQVDRRLRRCGRPGAREAKAESDQGRAERRMSRRTGRTAALTCDARHPGASCPGSIVPLAAARGSELDPGQTSPGMTPRRYSLETLTSLLVMNSSSAGCPFSVAAMPRLMAATMSPGFSTRSP